MEQEVVIVKHNIEHLEAQIRRLHRSLASLADDDLEELILIIKRPGWTTPAEFLFAVAMVESMQGQVKGLAAQKRALLAGSRAVGQRQ